MSQHTEKILGPLQMSRSMAMLSWSCVGSSCFANLDVRKHNQYHSDWVTVASQTALSYDSSDESMYSWPTKGSWGAGGEILGWNIKVLISCSKLWLLLWQHTPFWHTCHAHYPGNKIQDDRRGAHGYPKAERTKQQWQTHTDSCKSHLKKGGLKGGIYSAASLVYFLSVRDFLFSEKIPSVVLPFPWQMKDNSVIHISQFEA